MFESATLFMASGCARSGCNAYTLRLCVALAACLSMELRVPAQEPTLACHAAPAQLQCNGAGDELSSEDIQSLLQDALPAQQVSHNMHQVFHRLGIPDTETNMQGLADIG